MLMSISKVLAGLVVLALCVRPANAIQSSHGRCDGLFGQFVQAKLSAYDYEKQSPDREGKERFDSSDFKLRFDEWTAGRPAQWQKVIDAGRRYLGECPDGSLSNETTTLESMANAMRMLSQYEDAIPILRRCLSIDPGKSSCWLELGEVEETFCQFDDAKAAFRKVIENGGFTELNAIDVEMAKQQIEILGEPRLLARLRYLFGCPSQPESGSSVGSGSRRFGTGFFVTKQGYILTNNHVVEGCKTLTTRNGKALVLIDRDANADLALLKVDTIPDAVAIFRSGPVPKVGDEVIAFGFPLPGILSSEGNVSTGVLSAPTGIGDDIRFVQISAPVQPGNSGGPLLDRSGHVIGVIVSKLDALRVARLTGDVPQNVNFAVHWTEVRSFLDQEGVAYRKAASLNRHETGKIAAEAGPFTVGIDCAE